MAYFTLQIAASLFEQQKDTTPVFSFTLPLTDNTVADYDGAKKVTVPKGTSKTIDVSHIPNLRFVGMQLLAGTSFRLATRKAQGPNTDIEVGKFLVAELNGVEQIKLTAPDEGVDVVVRIFLLG